MVMVMVCAPVPKKKKNHQKPRKVGSYLQEYLEPAKTVKKKKANKTQIVIGSSREKTIGYD